MIGSNNCLGSPPSEDAARPEGLPRKRGGTGDYKGAALIVINSIGDIIDSIILSDLSTIPTMNIYL